MRLIDADAIKYTTLSNGGWGGPPEEVANKYDIDKMPAVDAVEVVRCKDCKSYHTMEEGFKDCINPFGIDMPNPDDFCSYGERRTDG